jgi:hypothetical protein
MPIAGATRSFVRSSSAVSSSRDEAEDVDARLRNAVAGKEEANREWVGTDDA